MYLNCAVVLQGRPAGSRVPSGAGRDASDLDVEGMPAAPRAGADAAVQLQGNVTAEGVKLTRRGLLFHLGEGRDVDLFHESRLARESRK